MSFTEERALAQKNRKDAAGGDRMAVMPVGRLVVSMSLPMMVSFFIQALYNVVDSIFVAQISENALTAVSLAFPMQMVMHAIAVGVGVGVSAAVPRALGSGDRRRASRIAGTAVIINLALTAFFMILGFTSARKLYSSQTDVEEIVTYGAQYISIIWVVCCGEFFGQLYEKMLVSSGRPFPAMISQACGAVFNIIFDPLLIFGIGIFPRMGVTGAALATVLGQVLAAAAALVFNLRLNKAVQIHWADLKPRAAAAKDILSTGFPSMVTIGLSSLSAYLINQILLTYSTTAAAAYGIWAKLQNFCFMPVFGMNNGIVPVLSYNYAGGLKKRVSRCLIIALTSILLLETGLFLVLELMPRQILTLFAASDNLMRIGTGALRLCLVSLPFGGAAIVMSTSMQALLHARFALIGNCLRQFVYLYAFFALISAAMHSLSAVWAAVPAAEALSCLTMYFLMRRMWRDLGMSDGAPDVLEKRD